MLNTKHHLNTVLGLFVICLALVVLSLPAFAKETRIRVGTLKITPGFKYTGEYDDNVFRERVDERDDYIHKFRPYILVEYSGSTLGNYFRAGYELDLVAYADYDRNNYQAHRPWISLGLDNLGPFYLKVDDRFVSTADPYGTANTYNVGVRTERWDNTIDTLLGYRFADKYALELFYHNYAAQFREDRDRWQDRIDHRFGATFLVKVASKTYLFGEYRRTDAEYYNQNEGWIPVPGTFPPTNWNSDNSQGYYLNDFFLGARFHPTGRLSGQIKVGYSERKWKNEFDPFGFSYVDDDTWVAEAGVGYILQKNASLQLNLQRQFLGSPDYNFQAVPLLVSSGYVDTLAGINYTHIFNRTTFRLGFDFNFQEYRDEAPGLPAKYFIVYKPWAGIDYRIIEGATLGLDYKYEEKVASDDVYGANEYTANVFSFYGDFVF